MPFHSTFGRDGEYLYRLRDSAQHEWRDENDEIFETTLSSVEPLIEGKWSDSEMDEGSLQSSNSSDATDTGSFSYTRYHTELYTGLLDRTSIREERIENGTAQWRYNTHFYGPGEDGWCGSRLLKGVEPVQDGDYQESEYDEEEDSMYCTDWQAVSTDKKQRRITRYFKTIIDRKTHGETWLEDKMKRLRSAESGVYESQRPKVDEPTDSKHQRLSPELGALQGLQRYFPKLSLLRSSAGKAAEEWTYCHDERVLFTSNGTYLY